MGMYIPARGDELDVGLTYAQNKYSISLDRDMLRTIFDKAVKTRATGGKKFFDASFQALQSMNIKSGNRFKAYQGAVSKMANYRRQRIGKRAKPPRRRSQRQRISERTSLNTKTNQYEMIV